MLGDNVITHDRQYIVARLPEVFQLLLGSLDGALSKHCIDFGAFFMQALGSTFCEQHLGQSLDLAIL